ncbi:MAG: alpha/beta hydrolase [Pseudomonadota bacterium]
MATLHINDVELYYHLIGEGEPIIFITGFSADHSVWLDVADKFAQHYQVILFDNRGSGQSSVPDYDYTIDMMADDTASLCEALELQSAHFIGSSMGGMILQNLAHRYPQLVKSATLVNTAAKADSKFGIFIEAFGEIMKNSNADLKLLIKMLLPWIYSDNFLMKNNKTEQLLKEKINYPYPTTPEGFTHQLHAIKTFDATDYLAAINSPCLVFGSDQDMIFNERETRYLADNIPNANYVYVENCGHLPQIEYPDTFFDKVYGFIRSI